MATRSNITTNGWDSLMTLKVIGVLILWGLLYWGLYYIFVILGVDIILELL